MRKKQPMTGWYNPVILVQTGIRVAISTVFGEFADRREALAAANAIKDDALDGRFDYRACHTGGDFWFDFVADTGDGWEPTHAVADLLARDHVLEKPRGRLLVMGGDQVYPTASPEEYDRRLEYPYDEAYRPGGGAERWPKDARPDLYAIPGNHDWYDGLKAFFHLFCRRTLKPVGQTGVDREGKVIGGRQTQQTRSYFALRLPQGWWLWGTDSQLKGYIDQPQIDFFQHVAEKWMEPGSKLVLCVGEPNWEYVDCKQPEKKYSALSYLTRLAPAVEGKGHVLKLVLSGDSHHYARYMEGDLNYITCGGGGAFQHPTHHLDGKEFKFPYPPPGQKYDPDHGPYDRSFEIAWKDGTTEEALYPSRSTSFWQTLGNFLFPFKNYRFPLFVLLPAYVLFLWILDFNGRAFGRGNLAEVLSAPSFGGSLWRYWELVVLSPWPVVLLLLALAGYRYFADVENGWGRLLMGALHALAHAAAVTVTSCLFIRWTAAWWAEWWGAAASLVLSAGVSAFVSGFVFGAYLWISLALLHRHWNEAYSSLRLKGYKSFLRMKIGETGEMTVYPIGLRRPNAEPELIEPAIEIAP